jgi:deoxyguanosine kinase
MNTFFDQEPPIVFSDFHIEKSLVFSKMNLSKSNYSIVENIHQSLFKNFPKPDMLIFLDSGIEHVSKNIKARNRDFEKDLGIEYLENLIKNYNFWLDKLKVPVIKIDAQSIHYDNEKLLLKNLSSLLKSALS